MSQWQAKSSLTYMAISVMNWTSWQETTSWHRKCSGEKKIIKERKETKNPYKTTPQTFEKKTKSQSPCHCNLSKHVVAGIRKKFPEEGFFLFSSCCWRQHFHSWAMSPFLYTQTWTISTDLFCLQLCSKNISHILTQTLLPKFEEEAQ